ncbi:hypothetical protein DUNSADRAFT_738 [Dunaliella salina]|uniref:Uncharacterized protein n=1 Tax=Dunaliella salina TaxID=3046 RepID=A0ABQ7GXW8_DUNSA|nr:hypothetical protein DUNSADRAFT_738 [Dunaliella salina]|eukprot:KAF5839453.1 hypothetical protein DUNSADRAFT_738 [Dunaliella salina]
MECRTAVHLAARSGDAKMLGVLLRHLSPEEKTAMVNTPDNFGITPVFLASQKMEEGQAAFEFLMSCGGRYK